MLTARHKIRVAVIAVFTTTVATIDPLQQSPVLSQTITKSAVSLDSWAGEYDYSDTHGKTAGGTGIVVEHKLKIVKSIPGLTAKLVSQGYQTDESIICDTKISGNKLSILFKHYPSGSTKNNYDVEQYKPGSTLLVLEQTVVNGKPKLLTSWAAFKLMNENAPNGRVYFQKKSAACSPKISAKKSTTLIASKLFNRMEEQHGCTADAIPAELADQVHYPLGVSFQKFYQIMNGYGVGHFLTRLEAPNNPFVGYKIEDSSPNKPAFQGQPWSPTYMFANKNGVYRLFGITGRFSPKSAPSIAEWMSKEFGQPEKVSDTLLFSDQTKHPGTVLKVMIHSDNSLDMTILDPQIIEDIK